MSGAAEHNNAAAAAAAAVTAASMFVVCAFQTPQRVLHGWALHSVREQYRVARAVMHNADAVPAEHLHLVLPAVAAGLSASSLPRCLQRRGLL
jgi:hypothetical protein